MTTNWFGDTPSPSDPSTFNYDTANQKLQRQRAAAQALQTLGLQSNQGQIIKGGDFTGFAGGNTLGTTLAHLATAYLGTKANEKADASQMQLSQDSQDALGYAMDPKNTPAGKRAAAAAALLQNNTVQAGDRVDPNGTPNNPDAQVSTFPVDAPSTSVNPMAQAAAQALAPRPNAAPAAAPPVAAAPLPSDPSVIPALAQAQTVSSTPRPMQSVTGGPQSFGMGGLSRVLGPHVGGTPGGPAAPGSMSSTDIANAANMFSAAPKPMLAAKPSIPGASGPMSPSDIALASKMFGGGAPQAPAPAAPPPGAVPAVSGASAQMPAAPMSAPMPPQGQAPLPQPQAPMPQQQAPMPQQAPQPPAPMPPQQAAQKPDDSQPTQAEQIAQLQAISRTGPIGQQLALAQMNNMFASKIGRFKTSVLADPVNGGFMKTTEDSMTGASKSEVIGGGNGTLVTGQTTDANGNRLNVHKDGSTTAMLDSSGKPVVDSSVVAKNDEHSLDVAGKHSSNAQAVSAIQTQLSNLNRMDALYNVTATGPVAGKMPAWGDDRNELASLTGANNFAAVREAVDGAGGGTQRFTQSELQHFAGGNGGLSLDTRPGPAHNLIANQRALLTAKLNAIQAQDAALQGTGAGSNLPSMPTRGQTVSASQWGFK